MPVPGSFLSTRAARSRALPTRGSAATGAPGRAGLAPGNRREGGNEGPRIVLEPGRVGSAIKASPIMASRREKKKRCLKWQWRRWGVLWTGRGEQGEAVPGSAAPAGVPRGLGELRGPSRAPSSHRRLSQLRHGRRHPLLCPRSRFLCLHLGLEFIFLFYIFPGVCCFVSLFSR